MKMIKKTFFTWPIKRLKQVLLYFGVVGFGTFVLFFLITSTLIGYDVIAKCDLAKDKYQTNDCADGLIQSLKDDSNTLKQRNQTIWALGQLGDEKALPVLESYYDGSECDHHTKLCQYELKKAINLVKSGFNLTAFVWQHKVN